MIPSGSVLVPVLAPSGRFFDRVPSFANSPPAPCPQVCATFLLGDCVSPGSPITPVGVKEGVGDRWGFVDTFRTRFSSSVATILPVSSMGFPFFYQQPSRTLPLRTATFLFHDCESPGSPTPCGHLKPSPERSC